uniref:Uncharacterized protein n=1 Tax=Phaseolus vulgaris TaxID=3885 RepID=Q69F93_PHAVU|nr:hypothetical protein BA15 [Phaseolus vulgaris]
MMPDCMLPPRGNIVPWYKNKAFDKYQTVNFELQLPTIIIAERHQMILEEKASIRIIIGSCILGTIFFRKKEIRLPDSTIRKSTIYANFASKILPHPENNMIHFRIDESVAHSQIPNSNNR